MADDRQSRKLDRYLSDIISYGQSIIDKLADVSLERFNADIDLLHIVAYRLQCVSEATKNVLVLDAGLVGRYPEIPWARVRAIGNRVRHEYGNVRADVIWEVARGNDVRSLVNVAKAELLAHQSRMQ